MKRKQYVSDDAARKRIDELEELVKYKDQYYAEVCRKEKALRAGVCDAIMMLVHTRGSNNIEYLEEQIEDVIKLLDDARTSRSQAKRRNLEYQVLVHTTSFNQPSLVLQRSSRKMRQVAKRVMCIIMVCQEIDIFMKTLCYEDAFCFCNNEEVQNSMKKIAFYSGVCYNYYVN